VLIQSEGGSIKVQGVDEGTQVNVYGINGTQVGTAISQNGAATVNTTLQQGSVAIIKVGKKSIKVMMK
jgi:aspartate 1-decarboxylase